MSLTSEATRIKQELNNSIRYCDNILTSTFFDRENQYRYRRYNGATSGVPTKAKIAGKTPNETVYFNDGYSGNFNRANNYIANIECWLFCDQATNIATTISVDDDYNVYVNDASIKSGGIGANQAITIPLKEGWNHLEMLLREGSGDDYLRLATSLHTKPHVLKMYAYKLGT